jgi:hypothetical protein
MRQLPAMKWAAGLLLFLNTATGFGQPLAKHINICVIAGVTYSAILDVRTNASGGVIISHKAGEIKVDRDELSIDFLNSWGIKPSRIVSPSWISSLETGISPIPYPYDLAVTNYSIRPTALAQMLSPKVREYIEHHGEVRELLGDAFRQATSNRSARICYFYNEDATDTPENHRIPLGNNYNYEIEVRENLVWPLDELVGIYFELINSQGDDKFQAIRRQADFGQIKRQDFVVAIAREEFHAFLKTQAFVNELRLSKQEMAESGSFRFYAGSPPDFEAFMSNVPPNYIGNYETMYDALRPPASPGPPRNTIGGSHVGQRINACVIGGVIYTNILDVYTDSSGGVTIMYKGGGLDTHRNDLSTDFL